MAQSRSSTLPAAVPRGEGEDVTGEEEVQAHWDTLGKNTGRSGVVAELCRGVSHVAGPIQVGGRGGAGAVPVLCQQCGAGSPGDGEAQPHTSRHGSPEQLPPGRRGSGVPNKPRWAAHIRRERSWGHGWALPGMSGVVSPGTRFPTLRLGLGSGIMSLCFRGCSERRSAQLGWAWCSPAQRGRARAGGSAPQECGAAGCAWPGLSLLARHVAVLGGDPVSLSLRPNSHPLHGLVLGLSFWHHAELQRPMWGHVPALPRLGGHVCTPVPSRRPLPEPGTGYEGSGASCQQGAAAGHGVRTALELRGAAAWGPGWQPVLPNTPALCHQLGCGTWLFPRICAAPSAAQPCCPWGL